MDILVFGAGSLGSLIGGLLAREHAVTLVGRELHVQAVRASGLAIEGAIETTVSPDARTDVPDSGDLAVVTVKSFDTEAAARSLTDCDLDSVLSLQNGLGNEATLAEQLDGVLAGTCTYGAMRPEPGRVRCTGVGEIVLGSLEQDYDSERAVRIGHAFEAAGLVTTVADDMSRRLWEKLAVNAGINATTALARVENGTLLDSPAIDTARAAARETARAAQQEGINVREKQCITAIEEVIDATADNRSSMLQDVRAGQRTEVDSINGYVAQYEKTPVNTTLTRLLRTWEQGLR